MNRNAIRLNFKYWVTHDLRQLVLNQEQVRFLQGLTEQYSTVFPKPHFDWSPPDLGQPILHEGEQQRFLGFLVEIWRSKFPDAHLVGSELVE